MKNQGKKAVFDINRNVNKSNELQHLDPKSGNFARKPLDQGQALDLTHRR